MVKIKRPKQPSPNQALQLYEGDEPLTMKDALKILSQITWNDIELLSKGRPAIISGNCIKHNNMHRGQGTCLAKKFLNYNPIMNYGCGTCTSNEIIDQLNYIFEINYGGKYRAEWRSIKKRKGYKPNPPPEFTFIEKKKRGRPKKAKVTGELEVSAITKTKPKPIIEETKKRGRPKGSKNKEKKNG